jgi:hypothetical protein
MGLMQRRIKQLIDRARQPVPAVAEPAVGGPRVLYTRELELAIKADVLAKRYYTYEEAAEKFPCSTEKMRLLAQGYPINRVCRPHRIPECVFKLIVRDNTIMA